MSFWNSEYSSTFLFAQTVFWREFCVSPYLQIILLNIGKKWRNTAKPQRLSLIGKYSTGPGRRTYDIEKVQYRRWHRSYRTHTHGSCAGTNGTPKVESNKVPVRKTWDVTKISSKVQGTPLPGYYVPSKSFAHVVETKSLVVFYCRTRMWKIPTYVWSE